MVVLGGERALAQALDEFPLTNDIKKGLLRRGGIYSDVFEMAMSYTNADWITSTISPISGSGSEISCITCIRFTGNGWMLLPDIIAGFAK